MQTVSQCMINTRIYGAPTVPVSASTYGAPTVPLPTSTYGAPTVSLSTKTYGAPTVPANSSELLHSYCHYLYILPLFPTYVPSLPVPVLGLSPVISKFLSPVISRFLSLKSSPGSCPQPVCPVISWFLSSACLSSYLQVPVLGLSLQSSPGSCPQPVSPITSWFLSL